MLMTIGSVDGASAKEMVRLCFDTRRRLFKATMVPI
jgi:hypothetical protein